jgi:HEAT-like repeat
MDILGQEDVETLAAVLQTYKESDLLNPLYSILYTIDETIRWHAISAFGLVVDRMAGKDMESARVVMRRFLWSLNDESGGIGWGAPEAMAEIMAKNKFIFREYGHMLLSYMREDGPEPFQDGNYLELPELQRGVVWGVGRLSGIYRETLIQNGVVADLLPWLCSRDDVVRGMAVWALGTLRAGSAKAALQKHLSDHALVSLYNDGVIIKTTVSDLACQALGSMS